MLHFADLARLDFLAFGEVLSEMAGKGGQFFAILNQFSDVLAILAGSSFQIILNVSNVMHALAQLAVELVSTRMY